MERVGSKNGGNNNRNCRSVDGMRVIGMEENNNRNYVWLVGLRSGNEKNREYI